MVDEDIEIVANNCNCVDVCTGKVCHEYTPRKMVSDTATAPVLLQAMMKIQTAMIRCHRINIVNIADCYIERSTDFFKKFHY